MSSLPNMKHFHCESRKAWLLLEGLNATFPVTLQAPIPLHRIASTGVGSHHACPDVPRALEGECPARAATERAWPPPWASSMAFFVLI